MWGRGEVRLIVCSEEICEGESRDSTEILIMPAGCGPLCSLCSLGLLTMKGFIVLPSFSNCPFHS